MTLGVVLPIKDITLSSLIPVISVQLPPSKLFTFTTTINTVNHIILELLPSHCHP